MERRDFLKKTGVGVAGTLAAAPAMAQSQPTIQWRLASSFPKSLDTLFGGAEHFTRRVAQLTGNRFQIKAAAAGELVPPLQVLDAVQNGTIECGHTASYYYVGKNPAFAFDTTLPFGLNTRQQNAWMYAGGGLDLMRDLFKEYGCVQFPAGNTGAQMGGWFRKEIKSVDDLKGLKMRIPGLQGQVLAKLGVVPQVIPGGEIYSALERGTIDATEWVGPYDDEKLGFQKVAQYYYYPGWWEGGAMLHNFINIAKWNSLPKHYQAIVHQASHVANTTMTAKYDAGNPAALKRLIAGGAQLRAFPPAVMDASYKAATDIYTELSATNPDFKKVYDAMVPFRNDQYLWWQVAEYTYDNFMIRTRPRG